MPYIADRQAMIAALSVMMKLPSTGAGIFCRGLIAVWRLVCVCPERGRIGSQW